MCAFIQAKALPRSEMGPLPPPLGLRSRAHGPAIVGLFVCRVCLLVGLFVCCVCLLVGLFVCRVCLLCVYCRPICLPCMSLMCLPYMSALYVCLIPASAGPLQLTHAPRHTNLGSTRVWAVCTYLHIYMHVYILIYRYRYIDRYIYNIFTHVHAYIHTYICMYVDIYMYIDAYLHTYIHVYIHTFVCMNPYRCTNSGCQPTSVIRTWRTTGPVRCRI